MFVAFQNALQGCTGGRSRDLVIHEVQKNCNERVKGEGGGGNGDKERQGHEWHSG